MHFKQTLSSICTLILFLTTTTFSLTLRLNPVQYEDEDFRVITQSGWGPCSLVAIANVLIYRKEINLNSTMVEMTSQELVTLLNDYLDRRYLFTSDQQVLNAVETIKSRLDSYVPGLEVNPRFDSVTQFDPSADRPNDFSASDIFWAFGVGLVHTWVAPQNNDELVSAINEYGANFDLMTTSKISAFDDKTLANNAMFQTAREWFDGTRYSESTPYGKQMLKNHMPAGFYALYQGHHFHVLYREDTSSNIKILDTYGIGMGQTLTWRWFDKRRVKRPFSFLSSSPKTAPSNFEYDGIFAAKAKAKKAK